MESSPSEDYSDEERMTLLEIDNSAADRLRCLDFEKVNFDDGDFGETTYQVIELVNLVGINRTDNVNDWLGLLFALHKQINFYLYTSRQNFEGYVEQLNLNCTDLPNVIGFKGKYYINAGGKHRLTIAKCIGLEFFPVTVTMLKHQSDDK